MKQTRFVLRVLVIALLVGLVVPGVLLGQSSQPNITALSFAPGTIDTGSAAVTVNVAFSLTGSGLPAPPSLPGGSPGPAFLYFETAFVDATGTNVIRTSHTYSGAQATAVNNASLPVVFPRFTAAGSYQVAYVILQDGGGSLILPTPADVINRFPNLSTPLTVTSTADSTPPDITALSYPASINTTGGAANLTLTFTVTDNLSGVASLEVDFVSPTGKIRTATATFATPPPPQSTMNVSFPKNSEPGVWTLTTIVVTDAAANTRILQQSDIQGRGFPMTTNVISTPDTAPPTLTSLSFSPSTLSTNGGTVLVNPVVSDDISGVSLIQVTFISPSNSQSVTGSAFISPPDTSPSTAASQIQLNFPSSTELGTWTQATVFLSDAAGNTNVINQSISLTVTLPAADTTPPLIFPTVSPMANGAGWNNTPVTVTWNVSDPESGIASSSNCGQTAISTPTIGTTVTCSATNGAGLSSSASVLVKIDTAAPVTSNVLATPDPVIINTDVTITATVTDTGGSNIASAEFQVDGGPFDDLTGAFGSSTVNVSLTLPGSATPLLQTPGVHNICVRGTDFASNIGAVECVLFAVYDPNGGFATGGGGMNSPAGADLANTSGTGPVTFAFNPKYLPNNPTTPSGDFEFHYNAGNINFKSTGYDFLVVTNGNRAQAQGTGTINGSTVCKFSIDAWNASFQPGNVDAFGLTIFNCGGGTSNRYVLPTAPITKGSIKIHQ